MRPTWRCRLRFGCTRRGCLWNWWPLQPPRRGGCGPAAGADPAPNRRRSARLANPPRAPRRYPGAPSSWPPHRMQGQLLYPPRRDFAHQQFVLVPAVDLVYRAELAQLFARVPEPAEDRSVELHLVDLAGHRLDLRVVVVRIRVGAVEILMRPGRDAHGPRRAHVVVNGLEIEVVVEDLHAAVAAVAHVNVALGIQGDGMRQIQLPGRRALTARGFQEAPVPVVLDHAGVSVAVGDEDVPRRVPADIRRTIERVGLHRRGCGLGWLRSSTQDHDNAALGIELDHHVRPFVHRPDVVLRIHPYGMREDKSVEPCTDLTQVVPLGVEFEEPGGLTARVDEDMSLGISG